MSKNLGRHLLIGPPKVDPRNRNYPVRRALDAAGVVPDQNRSTRKMWRAGPVLDQKQEPDCSGFSMTGVLMANPRGDFTTPVNVANAYAHNHTDRARRGHGIAAIAVDRGAIGSYFWCENLGDVVDALIAVGPVMASLPWYDSMWYPDGKGRLRVRLDNDPGYHAFALIGYDPAKKLGGWTGPAFLIRNSWGKFWGVGGNAWITCGDFERATQSGVGYDQSVCLPWGKTGKPIAQMLAENPDPAVS